MSADQSGRVSSSGDADRMDEIDRDLLALSLTGLSWEDVAMLGELDAAARQQYAHDRGACCWAGLIAAPGPCPWHKAEA